MNGTFGMFLNNSSIELASQMPTIEQQINIAFLNCLQWISFGVFLGGLGLVMFGMAYWIKTFKGGDLIANTQSTKTDKTGAVKAKKG